MMQTVLKVILCSALLIAAGSMPFEYVRGATLPEEEEERLSGQLTALASYIERAFQLQNEDPLTNEELRQIVRSGTTWLIHREEENGHFAYEYAPYSDEYLEGDNIVRQAGALFELSEVARKGGPETPGLNQALQQSISFFKSITASDQWDGRDISCVAYNSLKEACPLGATSLALTGILGHIEAYPEETETYEPLAHAYAAFILATKKDGEGFRNVYRIGEKTQSETESSFSNGEALLALVRYYQFEPTEEVREVIDETFEYLRDTPYDTPLYLWVMAALKDMNTLWNKEAYTTYAKAYTDWRTAGVSRFKHTQNNYCAYTEGIVSAYSLLEETITEAERNALRSEIDFWNRKNSSLQITENDRYRVNEYDGTLRLERLKNEARAVGGFLTAHDEVTERIDFTQHCISAYLQTLVDIERVQL